MLYLTTTDTPLSKCHVNTFTKNQGCCKMSKLLRDAADDADEQEDTKAKRTPSKCLQKQHN